MTIFVSSGAFQTNSLEEIIRHSCLNGIEALELSSGIRYRQYMLDHVFANRNISYLVHNYFPTPEIPFALNLASPDVDILEKSIELCKTAISLTSELDAPYYSVHSGYLLSIPSSALGNYKRQAELVNSQKINRKDGYELFLKTVNKLADYAKQKNVKLLLENNVITPEFISRTGFNHLLLVDASEINRFFTDLDQDNVGILVDVGHAKVSASAMKFDAYEFIEKISDHIQCFHLSDNNGKEDQNLMSTKNSWYLPLLSNYQGINMVIESYGLTIDQIKCQIDLINNSLK